MREVCTCRVCEGVSGRPLALLGGEYVEVAPKSLRLRKKILDANARKRTARTVEVA